MELFSRARAWNREQEKLDLAEAVAIGIGEALGEPGLIERLRQAWLQPEIPGAPAELKPEVEAALFGSVPVLER